MAARSISGDPPRSARTWRTRSAARRAAGPDLSPYRWSFSPHETAGAAITSSGIGDYSLSQPVFTSPFRYAKLCALPTNEGLPAMSGHLRIAPLLRTIILCLACLFGCNASPGWAADAPVPLLETGKSADWWFVFKFNTKSFSGCATGASRTCLFGGDVQD